MPGHSQYLIVRSQSHFVLALPPRVQDISANMARLAALGLEVRFTELDIRIQEPFADAKLAQQTPSGHAPGSRCAAGQAAIFVQTAGTSP